MADDRDVRELARIVDELSGVVGTIYGSMLAAFDVTESHPFGQLLRDVEERLTIAQVRARELVRRLDRD